MSARVLMLCAAAAAASAACAAEIHVAPAGNDSNPGTADKPLATLERARDAVRRHKVAHGAEANTILLHGGDYRLDKPVVFTPEDSGAPGKPLALVAAQGEKPVLTSAAPITGWRVADAATPALAREAQGKVWVADIPRGWRFHFLYADGKAMPVARLHKTDHWQSWSHVTRIGPVEPGGQLLGVPKGQLDDLPDNGDVEMNLLPVQWWNTLSVVRRFDRAASTLRRHSKSPTVCDIKDQFICNGGNYNLQNALKFLTQRGEWAVDSAQGKVYFWPEQGSPNDVRMAAPMAYRLLELKGDSLGRIAVHDLEVRGLTFTCTDRLPEDQWPDEWVKRQAELPDAMLFMDGVERCMVDSCTFTFSGSYAVALQNYAQGNRITRNEMGWLGCGGVLLQGFGPGKTDANRNNVVQRNYIHHTGNGGYMHSAAVTLYQSNSNDIALNWLDNLPYAAIQIAGCHMKEFGPGKECKVWDSYGNNEAMYKPRYDELPQGRNTAFTRETLKPYLLSGNNRIRRNVVTNYMNKLHDGGALYCWGCGNGNLWEGNLLRRDKSEPGEDLCIAIYMDDEVDQATIKDNICWHVGRPTINKGANTWENNIISPQKPAAYDARLADIVAEAEREGGLAARPPAEAPAPPRATQPLAPGTWVPAANVVELNGPRFHDDKRETIGWCEGGGSLVFGPYRFAPGTIKGMEVMVGVDPKFAGQKMHVRLDAADGSTVGTFVFQSTGGFEVFQPQSIPVKDVAGEHRLVFVFEGHSGICNFKQFQFTAAAPGKGAL